MSDLSLLERRLDRLEREGRRWRRTALALGLALGAILAAGAGRDVPAVVEAQRFVLKDPTGAELGVWGVDPTGSPMLLLSREKASALLTLTGPALNLRADDGKRGAFLGVDTQGDSRLELRNARYLDGVRLVSRENGSSGLYLLDRDGDERGTAEVTGEGHVLFSVRDAERRVRGTFGLDARSIPNLVLFDELGRRRIGMLVHPGEEGSPLLALEDGLGRVRAQVGMDPDGSAELTILRPDGNPSFQAP